MQACPAGTGGLKYTGRRRTVRELTVLSAAAPFVLQSMFDASEYVRRTGSVRFMIAWLCAGAQSARLHCISFISAFISVREGEGAELVDSRMISSVSRRSESCSSSGCSILLKSISQEVNPI